MYWLGNAAKTEVVARIIERATGRDRPMTVFDFGCGTGGDWPRILAEVPQIRLVAYDPDSRSAAEAQDRLRSTGATVLSGGSIATVDLQADVIVSFSVFEHVYDRTGYLATAKRLLAPDGTFFLNYDDGHFRVAIDVDRPSIWPADGRRLAHNLLAPVLARIGRVSDYQRRVRRDAADKMLGRAGFRCRESFYSNCDALKELYKTIPNDRREEYCRLWVEFEGRLNESFVVDLPKWERGDNVNLWQRMPTRTLVLDHSTAGDG